MRFTPQFRFVGEDRESPALSVFSFTSRRPPRDDVKSLFFCGDTVSRGVEISRQRSGRILPDNVGLMVVRPGGAAFFRDAEAAIGFVLNPFPDEHGTKRPLVPYVRFFDAHIAVRRHLIEDFEHRILAVREDHAALTSAPLT